MENPEELKNLYKIMRAQRLMSSSRHALLLLILIPNIRVI
jgi:hypothetical protein